MTDQLADVLKLDHRSLTRRLMRASPKASLATLLPQPESGPAPYASLVTVACDHDASPILLLSQLADHSRNIQADARVSLLFDGTTGFDNPQAGPRATVMGRIRRSDEPRHRARFLARHPAAALYAGFTDFAFYVVEMERAHFVGGFARAVWLEGRLKAEASLATAMAEAEAAILAHMNADHAEALDLYANILLGLPGTGWRMAGIDLDGLDLALGEKVARLDFDRPLKSPDQARATLVALAAHARQSR
ncbi:HugZ family protein [Telmatospirillum sp. J64-1]|uniref:HugZ family pyridoxamine 5'-phosphate oxidase n=1 Tax=Telmatospirillum sp. J64-1 TaxID=2502183 RepID=UPI00115C5E67|nr:DUF2470 domain-containing protein [Telmatospirillum sp. J64-1]